MPDSYIIYLTGVGVLIALVAWAPMVLRRAPLSLPIIGLILGATIFSLPQVTMSPSPLDQGEATERITEFVVIIALMGAGLKLDRVFGWRRWRTTWRLLAITMPLCILAILALGVWGLGLGVAAALLLASSLAPTDPVLAADVQVGPPRTGQEDEVRFGLTSEAGLNDGLAFPFVNLAIAISLAAAAATPPTEWLAKWFTLNVVWEVVAGVGFGWLIGKAFGWLTFHLPGEGALARTGDGFLAIAATFISYGVTEMLHCYGFLAVFVTALAYRHAHREHDFHEAMHDFVEQVERLAMMAVMLLFGGAIADGLLGGLTLPDVVASVVIVLIIRPVAGLVGLLGLDAPRREKVTLAFFGIRGVGSFYYLAYGLNAAGFEQPDRLWGIVGLACLISILLHGVTVTPAMRWLDRSLGRDPDAPEREAIPPPGFGGPEGETPADARAAAR